MSRQIERLDDLLSKVIKQVAMGKEITGKFSADFPEEWRTITRVTKLYEPSDEEKQRAQERYTARHSKEPITND